MIEAKTWRLSESVRLPVTVFVQTYRYYDAEPETVTAAQERTEMVRRALGAVIRETDGGRVLSLRSALEEKDGAAVLVVSEEVDELFEICDRIAVMYLGSMVELATSDELYANTLHPYSKALLSAVPIPDPKLEAQKKRQIIEGDVPSPINKPKGCAFSSRCPLACDKCRQSAPTLKEAAPGHFVACHLVEVQG